MSNVNSSSFKRRVRARMAATGASYTTAMRALQAATPAAAAVPYRRPPAESTWSYHPPSDDHQVRRLRTAERNWAPFLRALEKLGLHPYFELRENADDRDTPTLFAESGGDRCVEICSSNDTTPRTPRGAVALRDRTQEATFLVYVHARGGMVADGISMDYHPDRNDTPEVFARRVWALVDETRRNSGCVSFVGR